MTSKAKWFAVRKPNTGEIIAISANQIVPPKFRGPTKMLYYIHQTPPPLSSCSVEGGSGDETTIRVISHYSGTPFRESRGKSASIKLRNLTPSDLPG